MPPKHNRAFSATVCNFLACANWNSPNEPAIPPLPMTELALGFNDALDLMEPRGDFITLPFVSRSPLLKEHQGSSVKTNADNKKKRKPGTGTNEGLFCSDATIWGVPSCVIFCCVFLCE